MRKNVARRFSFRDAGRGCQRIVAMHYRLPTTRRPIVNVGAGGIVRDLLSNLSALAFGEWKYCTRLTPCEGGSLATDFIFADYKRWCP